MDATRPLSSRRSRLSKATGSVGSAAKGAAAGAAGTAKGAAACTRSGVTSGLPKGPDPGVQVHEQLARHEQLEQRQADQSPQWRAVWRGESEEASWGEHGRPQSPRPWEGRSESAEWLYSA